MSDVKVLSIARLGVLGNERHLKWFLIGTIILIMGVHLLSLTSYPQAFIDEGWLANTSWSWLKTGVVFDKIHAGPLDQFGYEWVTDNFLAQLPYTLVYQILGVGLFQTRLVAWLFGVVLLFTTIQVGRHLYSLNTGLLAALLLSLSPPFLESSRIRQDIVLAAMIMTSFWLALYGLKNEKLWAHFLAGLIVGLGFDVQQSAIIFIPPLAAIYLVAYGKRVFVKPATWIVGIGGALGLAYYVITHILPNYAVYSKLMSFYFVSDADARIPLTNPDILVDSVIREISRYRFRSSPFDLAMIILGGVFLFKRRSKSDVLLLTFTIGAYLSFALLSSNKTPLYAINLYPFFMLVVAAGLIDAVSGWPIKNLARVTSILLIVFAGYRVYQTAARLYDGRDYDYYAITKPLRDLIPSDKRVMGMPTWWFGFTEYDYSSSLNITYYRFFNDYNVSQALETLRPDYLIVDDAQRAVLVDDEQVLPQGMNVYRVSRTEFETFLNTHTELVWESSTPWNNNLQLYRVNWDD